LAEANPRTLLLIPSDAKRGVEADVAANLHPTMDYFALQARLGADIADYVSMKADRHPLVKAARRAHRDLGLAVHGFIRAGHYDVVFSNGENVGIPLAGMFAARRRRPGHVVIGHRLSPPKKKLLMRTLHPQMDAVFVYAATQLAYALDVLAIPRTKLHLIPFQADTRFFQPLPNIPVKRRISSAGLELRDYPTLIEAVRGVDVEVCLGAASPWSKRENETAGRTLPSNVSARSYSYRELRDLYASSSFVVVPLYENDFQAGVTTILEAMAMAKAVIVTRTSGQRNVIEDGVNGIYVPAGDPRALRSAIVNLLEYPEEAIRLGRNARKTIESNMSLDLWVQRVSQTVNAVAVNRTQPSIAHTQR
jgi:glycosyltransferase involved in cell wall biosynthesis